MDYAQVFAVSAGGMTLERTRVEVAALNLANANTVQDASGAVYRPMRVVARATPFAELVDGPAGRQGRVPAPSLEAVDASPRLSYEPGHPLTDGQGFVAYAGVDPAAEMVTLMTALRSYEANVAAMNTARALALKTLDIGRGG
jgi:flagellar basal-body rod protein FlgC